jgi:hypothetical protein
MTQDVALGWSVSPLCGETECKNFTSYVKNFCYAFLHKATRLIQAETDEQVVGANNYSPSYICAVAKVYVDEFVLFVTHCNHIAGYRKRLQIP